MSQPLIAKMNLKTTLLKLCENLPGANELMPPVAICYFIDRDSSDYTIRDVFHSFLVYQNFWISFRWSDDICQNGRRHPHKFSNVFLNREFKEIFSPMLSCVHTCFRLHHQHLERGLRSRFPAIFPLFCHNRTFLTVGHYVHIWHVL